MKIKYILFICYLFVFSFTFSQGSNKFKIHNLGKTIYEGVFTGNGLLGSMLFIKGDSSIRVNIGRTDVYDHRDDGEDILFSKPRLPIGYFEIGLFDQIKSADGEIDYKKAEALASITTSTNNLSIRSITFAEKDIFLIEITEKNDFDKLKISWVQEKARSSRFNFSHAKKPINFIENSNFRLGKIADFHYSDQPLLAGGGYAVVYHYKRLNKKSYIIATISYAKEGDDYLNEGVRKLKNFKLSQLNKELKSHQNWWSAYYQKSSLSIPDIELQDFYNMQLYKLACATRENKPAIDLQGPWTANTPWPAYWHNLNIQLTYSPVYTANHLELGKSLVAMIDKNIDNLIKNVPKDYQYNSAAIGRSSSNDLLSPVLLHASHKDNIESPADAELGNLTWMLFSYYQQYRYAMDSKLYDGLFPILKRSVNYYIHLLEKNKEGKYYIAVKTYSPEYTSGYAYNTNYDLSILKWGLKTLISMDNEKGRKDELHETWLVILNNLIEYQKDDSGLMIAQDVPYEESHRHYSHLMMIYPFYDLNWDNIESRDLVLKSISHWQSKSSALQGYSFTGLASMKAMMGDGNAARDALKVLYKKYIKPNTLYAESGPVIETPLAAMASIQELCLQHWNHTTRIFPAIPSDWKDVSFKNFLTDGAFLISADRKEGKTVNVFIQSQYPGSLKIKSDFLNPIIKIKGKGDFEILEEGLINLKLESGSSLQIREK